MTPLRKILNGRASWIAYALICVPSNTWTPPGPDPTATFSISRTDFLGDDQLFTPVALWFTASSISGFQGFDGSPISEPAGDANDYDPTALEVFWAWDFDDEGYTPLITPNVPLTHRDSNRAYSKRAVHVFTQPGAKTVRLYGFDSQGNWGTASYTMNDVDGDVPAIGSPDDAFDGADVAYFSVDGIFPASGERPAGSTTHTTVSSLNSWVSSRRAGAAIGPLLRIRLRRGETYTDISEFGANRMCYVDAYGTGDPPKQVRTNAMRGVDGPFNIGSVDSLNTVQSRIIDQDWQGPYDAATDTGARTGPAGPMRSGAQSAANMLWSRFRISGHDTWQVSIAAGRLVFHDMDITNWRNYGHFGLASRTAYILVDNHQKADALNGISQGDSTSDPYDLGARHGPVRVGGARDLYFACTSFFSRNGWSPFANRAWSTVPPSVCQAAFRFGASNNTALRNYVTYDRCSFEGGAQSFATVDFGAAETPEYFQNLLFESCLFVATSQQWGATSGMVETKGASSSVRNSYFYVPDVPNSTDREYRCLIRNIWQGTDDPTAVTMHAHFNNTAIIARGALPGGDVARAFTDIDANFDTVYLGNNVYYAPELPGPTHGPYGLEFEPLGTAALAGFTPRYIGDRWAFKPVGWNPALSSGGNSEITCESVREIDDGIGRVTAVGQDEWMAFDYPDYSGQCNGAGDALMAQVALDGWAAVMAARTGTYDQVTYQENSFKARAVANNGFVAFDFTDTKIRVQNLSTASRSGLVTVVLDLRDWLMDPVTATANPATIPAPVPGTGSAALTPETGGLVGWRTFGGTVRDDYVDEDGATGTAATAQGAFAPA